MNCRRGHARLLLVLTTMGLALLTSCGGGGGGSSIGPPPPPAPPSITTNSLLPGTLQGQHYSTTLSATGGTGQLHWSISPISPTTLFVDGLTIDVATGVLSGTVNWAGTAGFVAQVTDSGVPAQTATKSFSVTAYSPLQPPAAQAIGVGQYGDVSGLASISVQGGVQPLSFTVTGGSLPFELRLDSNTGRIFGSATSIGVYPFTVTIQDSYSPPEVVTAHVTITVIPPPLEVTNSLPLKLLLNRPFSGRVVVRGGIPPYQFSLSAGALPPGLNPIDPSSGYINGTPNTAGAYFFTVNVKDSSSPSQQAAWSFDPSVVQPLGRNDSPATATAINNGMFNATISPYIDPPSGTPAPGDNDYYKLVSLGGSTVHLETWATRYNQNNPLDTVLEVVDGNGIRRSTCRQPGDTSNNFSSACINDDIAAGTLDSALDFQVPGLTNAATTFYVHVLDWRGDARPDMRYALQVSGVVSPLSISATPLLPAARGLSYSQQLSSSNGSGTVSWSLTGGSVPPGLVLSSSGAISGTATTDGTYSFTIMASDSASPPQTATAQETIQVVEPVKITSSATFPDACVNQPYSFALQTSGGLPPLTWTFYSSMWVAINLNQSTGVFSGTTNVTGTFTGSLGVVDATTHGDSQQVTLTVKQCP